MSANNHPLERLSSLIEERGLIVIDNVTQLPAYGEPYVYPHLVICLCHKGWARAEYDMTSIEFHSHDTAIIFPNHILKSHEVSDDYEASLLVISAKFLKELSLLHPNHYRVEYHYHPSYHLTDSQYECMNACFRLLASISRLEHPDRKDLLAEQMDMTARLVELFIRENGKMIIKKDAPVQQLLARFHGAIAEHFRESREVKFYAKQLCLSPKHFGTVVRQATGTGAGEWIAHYVIAQAKHLLRHRPDLSIQQVSLLLGFSEQTAFTRYFKANSGQTPKEYRETE